MKITKELYEKLSALASCYLDEQGREVPNPKPLVLDVSPRPPSLQEQIQRLVRKEVSAQAELQEMETFEESQDFDIPGEDDLQMSGFEVMEDEEPIYKSPQAIIDDLPPDEISDDNPDQTDPETPSPEPTGVEGKDKD